MNAELVGELAFQKRDTEHYEYPRLCKFQDDLDLNGFKAALSSSPGPTVEDHCIYIHIPFCSTICTFCNYFKILDRSPEQKNQFVGALISEIETYGKFLHDDKKKISGVHFGGGTPSVLEEHHFQAIFSALRANFEMSGCDLFSLEATLKSLAEKGKIESLERVGFNRVSFGVQSLNPEIRRKIGVRYQNDQLYELCRILSRGALNNFNADLMYNLPTQSVTEIAVDTEELLGLGVNNIDLYFLNAYPNTNIEKLMKDRGAWERYSAAAHQLEFGQLIYEGLSARNLNLIFSNTISRKSTKVHRTLSNALGNDKFEGGNQLSFGPSARGYIDGYIYKNEINMDGYFENVARRGFGYSLGRQITRDEAEERTMVMFPNFTRIRKSDIPNPSRFEEKIGFLLDQGILEDARGDYRVVEKYNFFAGNISAYFQGKNERIRAMRSYFFMRKNRLNFYNQDKANIAKHAP